MGARAASDADPGVCTPGEIRNNGVVEIVNGAPARVAQALLDVGQATVAELADRLELSGAAVRKHMDELVEAGMAEASDRPSYGPDNRRRGRGRPARYYHLTQSGRDSFGNSYDDVAVGALRFLAESGGEDAVMEFARRRVAEFERRYADVIDLNEPMEQRADVLADSLAAEGYAAVVVPGTNGIQLCQHNCPVAHVAAEFPQFCEAETEAFGRMLGTHVMRLATLSHGDGVCTTHIPTAIGHSATSSDDDRAPAYPEGRTTP